MIKKILILTCAAALVLSAACTKKEEPVPENNEPTVDVTDDGNRTVSYDELGLTYTTPEDWKDFEKTNLYPTAYALDDVFAVIDYSYVTEADYGKYMSGTLSSLDNSLYSICKIAVIADGNEDSESALALFHDFDNVEKAAEQDGYKYYVLFGYIGSLESLPDTDKAAYGIMADVVPELIDSIEVYPFDDKLLNEKTDNNNKIITFITQTLESKDINSSVFADYDVTLFNIWGTNAYPDYNEFEVLEEVYKWIQNEGLKVNIIMAVTDTPSAENEVLALKIKDEAGAEFTTIMLDETLAKWVTNNITAIPTTVMVNNEATVISDQAQGIHTVDFYKDLIISALETSKK